MPFPSPGDLLDPETEPVSPAMAGRFFTAEPSGKPWDKVYFWTNILPWIKMFHNGKGVSSSGEYSNPKLLCA